MPEVLGYICSRTARVEQDGEALAQRERIEAYAKDHALLLHSIIVDSAQFSQIAWFERPSGQRLASLLEPGSQVIVCNLETIGLKLVDLLSIIENFNERGIVLTIIDLPATKNGLTSLSTTGEMGELCANVLRMMTTLATMNRSDAVSEGMQDRKHRGRKHCHYAGYGHHWRYGKRKVHSEEQETIAKIVVWREQGFSWNEIAARLLRHRVLTADGREWSASRVRRAYLSAKSDASRMAAATSRSW
jgi:DNA invertase Pin-like site-specific DNA recombinase